MSYVANYPACFGVPMMWMRVSHGTKRGRCAPAQLASAVDLAGMFVPGPTWPDCDIQESYWRVRSRA